jgi:hypothetical protein
LSFLHRDRNPAIDLCWSESNTNTYGYSFTYTNSHSQAIADAKESAYTEAAPNSTAETIAIATISEAIGE